MLSKMVARSLCLLKILEQQISRNFDAFIMVTKINKRWKRGYVSKIKGYVKHAVFMFALLTYTVM